MLRRSGFVIISLVVAFVLFSPQVTLAWGPATHIKLASDILEQLGALTPALAALLGKYARDFIFGNIAADVVFAKKLSRIKQFCHQWSTAFGILDGARNEPTRAFAYGYLAHLAADTVAHNKFLPRQMTLTRSTMSFGHLYWELRADSAIGTHYWNQLRLVLDGGFEQHETILAQRLTDTLLPFQWNRAIFYRLNTVISRKGWIRTMDAWYHRSRWVLPDDVLADYRGECVDRAIDVLSRQRASPVTREDPNGTMAIGYTRVQRKQHRQMARAGILYPHVLTEATARRNPVVSPRNGIPRNGNLVHGTLSNGNLTHGIPSTARLANGTPPQKALPSAGPVGPGAEKRDVGISSPRSEVTPPVRTGSAVTVAP
jgi:hypothetical protein